VRRAPTFRFEQGQPVVEAGQRIVGMQLQGPFEEKKRFSGASSHGQQITGADKSFHLGRVDADSTHVELEGRVELALPGQQSPHVIQQTGVIRLQLCGASEPVDRLRVIVVFRKKSAEVEMM
ncbi:uncharacterized protein METZ01_LOCUS277795, partial [marine metagenome]